MREPIWRVSDHIQTVR